MRYFFHLAYRGTNYSGWQKHPDAVSVQQIIENALSQILKQAIQIIGCGRTDAHVHASQYFFHVDIEKTWDYNLLYRLNRLLPDDIAVFNIIPMEGLPHARFDATQRTYDYFIHTRKDPFLNNLSAYYPLQNLNLHRMQDAALLLPKYSDYRAFCTSPDKNEHTICHLSKAEIYTDAKGEKIRFHVSSNRFLSKMIRIIMGKLLKIGEGKLSVDEFESHLITKTTPLILDPAYPQGLYLSKIVYPYLDIPFDAGFSNNIFTQDASYWKQI